MTWTLASSGTVTPTVGTPVVLATDTDNATYVFAIDTSALALGDLLQVQISSICLAGGNQVVVWEGYYQHAQVTPHKVSPFVASDISLQVIINQSAGTARAFPWKLLRA